MSILEISIITMLCIILLLLFIYVCSGLSRFTQGLALLAMIPCCCAISFLMIDKNVVIKTDKETIKVINVSYECPDCDNYISSLETKYCSRCGKNLTYVKNGIQGTKK